MIIPKLDDAYLLATSLLPAIVCPHVVCCSDIVVVANDYDPYSMSISDVG